jgi:hypothetical protein
MDIYDRHFLRKLFDKVTLNTDNGCWEILPPPGFIPRRPRAVYKRMGINAARAVAHIFYKLDLMDLQQYACHHCDNFLCVNPDHIHIGTPSQNVNDAIRRGRLVYKKRV